MGGGAWRVFGVGWFGRGGGGIPKVGGAYAPPTTTTCIPLGGMCV